MRTEVRAIATTAAVVCGALVVAGCAGSGPKQTAHDTTTPPTTSSSCCDASPTGARIQLARSSSPLFAIFPAAPGKRACLIPAGGLARTRLHGTCRTLVQRARTHEPAIVVSFTEIWMSGGKCPPGAYCPVSMPLQHTWKLVEGAPVSTPGARLHILATRQSGAPAPQFND